LSGTGKYHHPAEEVASKASAAEGGASNAAGDTLYVLRLFSSIWGMASLYFPCLVPA